MRHFYLFQIKQDIKKITYDNPYELFHTLETIYYEDRKDVLLRYHFLNQLIEPMAIKKIDIDLFSHYKENYFYTKYKNIHSMHDVYRHENTKLTLYKTYFTLETNVVKPRFFEELQKYADFFVCDFEEKDYFWLSSFEQMMIG